MRRPALSTIAVLSVFAFSCVDSANAPATAAATETTSQAPAEEPAKAPATSIADPGGTWKLVELPEGTAVPDEIEITITFDGTTASGSSGCNSYNGTITETAPGELEPGLFAGTQMFCEGPAMDMEGAYLKALSSARSYEVNEGRLAIGYEADGGTEMMVFVRQE